MKKLTVLLFSLSLTINQAYALDFLVVEGRLTDSAGQVPEEGASVSFTLEVLTDDGNDCVLYSENHGPLDMSGSNGYFSLHLGQGTPLAGAPMVTALDNSVDNHNSCTYSPAYNAHRKLRISYNNGGGVQTLSQLIEIGQSAYAMEAQTIDGYGSGDLLKLNPTPTPDLTQANLEFVFNGTNWPELQALLNGSSASFSGSGLPLAGGSMTGAINMGGNAITNLPAPTAANDAATKGYVDTAVTGLGDITDVVAGVGLVGGAATGSATLGLSSTGVTAGSYGSGTMIPNFTVDNEGRISVAGQTAVSFAETDPRLLTLTTAEVNQLENIDAQTISNAQWGYLSGMTAQPLEVEADTLDSVVGRGASTTTDILLGSQADLRLGDSSAGHIAIQAPVTVPGNYTLTLPSAQPTASQIMVSDASGNFSWQGLPGVDDMGNHTASQNIQLGAFWLSGDGGNEGVFVHGNGRVGVGNNTPATILDISGTLKVADGSETCSVGADGGMIRYNGGNLQYCNGTAWQTLGVSGAGLTSLNGQTGSTQSFANGAAGTAPAFSSAGNTHTLNIPLASGAGVTSGTISKTEYDSFNNKVDRAGDTMSGQLFIDGGADQVQLQVDANAVQTANILEIRNSGGTSLATISSDGSISAATDLATKNYVDTAVTGVLLTEIVDSDADTRIQVEESADEDTIRFDTAGVERMIIDASGNIGIGEAAPAVALDVGTGTINASQICDENNSGCIDLSAGVGGYTDGDTILAADGFAATPGLSFNSDPNMGLFRAGTNNLGVSVGGNETLRIYNSGAVARLGVGIASPLVALDVGGNTAIRVPQGTTAQRPTPSNGMIRYNSTINMFEGYENGAWVNLRDSSGHPMLGNLDLGNNNISNLSSGSASSPSLSFDSDIGTGLFSPGGGQVGFASSGNEVMRLMNNERVAIGTTGVPMDDKLTVYKEIVGAPTTARAGSFKLRNASGTTTTAIGLEVLVDEIGGSNTNAYGIRIQDIDGTNQYGIYQMGVDDNNFFAGNVGIGVTNPSHELEVAGDIEAEEIAINNDVSDPILKLQNESAGFFPKIRSFEAGSAGTATSSGEVLLAVEGFGKGATAYDGQLDPSAQIRFEATENHTDSAHGTAIHFATTPNGTETPNDAMIINDNGNVQVSSGNLEMMGGNIHLGQGTIVGGSRQASPAIESTGVIDFIGTYTAYAAGDCSNFRLDNVNEGGVYYFYVPNASAGTCTFNIWSGVNSGTDYTERYVGGGLNAMPSSAALFTIRIINGDALISWEQY